MSLIVCGEGMWSCTYGSVREVMGCCGFGGGEIVVVMKLI